MKTINNTESDYNKWIKHRINKNLKPLTKTQWEFGKFCFEHKEILAQIGDLETIFSEIRNFIKYENNK